MAMNELRVTLGAFVIAFGAVFVLASAEHEVSGQEMRGARVSPIVLPTSAPAIRSAHDHPEHRRLRCERCHAGASDATRAGAVGVPTEASCGPCHAAEIERRTPYGDRCTLCHIGFEDRGPGRAPVVPDIEPTPERLRFSHAAHDHVRCLECHEGVDEPNTLRPHLPDMRSCHRCHGGPSPAAASECTTCHLELPDGRMRSVFPEGTLNPPRWLFGMHHDREWLTRHRWIAADQTAECAVCHSESECADCHDGRVRPNRVHPNDFLLVHAQLARREADRCTSCHTTQAFCTECHSILGLSPMSAPVVRAAGRFHPPADVWLRGPVLHGREARRSMNDCVSCHSERDCVTCHGTLGIGAGLSPHGNTSVGALCSGLRANDRACRLCHSDFASLSRLCAD
jgi:hypothetical protein